MTGDVQPRTGQLRIVTSHVETPGLISLAAGFSPQQKTSFQTSFEAFFPLMFFPETNPKEILHMSDCMIVIMTDESQKWKIASLECASDLFGLFFSRSLFPPSSLTLHHSVCLFFDSPLSSCFISPYISLFLLPRLPAHPSSFLLSLSVKRVLLQ